LYCILAITAIATGLRIWGIDTTTSPEEGLIGASDEQQLAFCLSQIGLTHESRNNEPQRHRGHGEMRV